MSVKKQEIHNNCSEGKTMDIKPKRAKRKESSKRIVPSVIKGKRY